MHFKEASLIKLKQFKTSLTQEFTMTIGSGAMLEHSQYHPKVKGLSPSSVDGFGAGRYFLKKMSEQQIL